MSDPIKPTAAQVDAVLYQMATFQDGNAQPHTIALINEMADLLQAFAIHREAGFEAGRRAGLEEAADMIAAFDASGWIESATLSELHKAIRARLRRFAIFSARNSDGSPRGPGRDGKTMSAILSPCGLYRYRLERSIGGGLPTAVIMVNPSTADAEDDDATIRKLRGFAQRRGWGTLIVGNLFAYRATDVRELSKVTDPVGAGNDEHLAAIFRDARHVVFAWGPLAKQPKYHRGRWRKVYEMASRYGHQPLCIGRPAKCGHPKHPLMLPYDSPIVSWFPPSPTGNGSPPRPGTDGKRRTT